MSKRGRRKNLLTRRNGRSSTRSASLPDEPMEEADGGSVNLASETSNSAVEEDDSRNTTSSDLDNPVTADVDRCYRQVIATYERTVIKEGEDLFLSMREEAKSEPEGLTKESICPLEIVSLPIREYPTTFCVRSVHSSAVEKCPSQTIEYVAEKPRMRYWTVTECNITCDDEHTLSHIPFLADEDDGKFGEELQKTFSEGIHGTKKGSGHFINDHILHAMMEKLSETYKTDEEIKQVCRGINTQFPNKATVQQLIALFKELLSVAGMVASTSRETGQKMFVGDDRLSYSSFQLLSCRRCFTYDCLLHGIHSHYDSHAQRKDTAISATTESCGPDCFKIAAVDSKEKLLHPGENEDSNICKGIKIQNIAQNEGLWNPAHVDILLALRTTFKNDYCKIAKTFNATLGGSPKRTCHEVYSYLLQMAPVSPRSDAVPRHKTKKKKITTKDRHRQFRSVKWARTEGKVRNSHLYEPCRHSGLCTVENGCYCASVENLCTKFCCCPDTCIHKFPGCRCAPGLCCTKQCQCFFASWECDPDICKSCKCDSLEEPNTAVCRNISIQRGLQKKLSIGASQVAGWGCFAEEDVGKNEFISEYCGEVITHDESERRGKIYDKLKCSYLFGLNDEMVVDATRKGNLIRFANHSKSPNCFAQVFMVNGDHRIGIFAQTDIKKGEELFFDYSYNAFQQMKFVSKDRPKPK